jgi:hypothetical protein
VNRPRGAGRRKQQIDAAGKKGMDDALSKIEESADKTRQGAVQKNVDKFFEHKKDEKKDTWTTEGKGLAPQGELLTLEDLMYLKPFAMEDLNSTVAFRANDKMMRAFQRLKEASGGVYDIMSDLYRDAAAIGLLVLSERHKSILGMEIAISRMENIQRLKEEAAATIKQLKAVLWSIDEEMKLTHFKTFTEAMMERPAWIQEMYLSEIRKDPVLSKLMDELGED